MNAEKFVYDWILLYATFLDIDHIACESWHISQGPKELMELGRPPVYVESTEIQFVVSRRGYPLNDMLKLRIPKCIDYQDLKSALERINKEVDGLKAIVPNKT